MARDDEAVRQSAEQSAAILTAAGLPRMPARVLMTLVIADAGGLTSDEIAARLEISAGAVSGAVRYLEALGIVRRLAMPGSRKSRYEVPESSWLDAFARERPVYRALAAQAEAGVAALDDADSIASRRLDEMGRFYRFIDKRLPELMAEWERMR